MAFQTKKGTPFEYQELLLCREFHCLPDELAKQDSNKMELFLDMINIERQFQDKRQRLAQQKSSKNYGTRG